MTDLNNLRYAAWKTADDHGFHDTEPRLDADEALMLVVSEAGEAADAFREAKLAKWYECPECEDDSDERVTMPPNRYPTEAHVCPRCGFCGAGKPCGFASEVADTFIRLLDLSGTLNVDLNALGIEIVPTGLQMPLRPRPLKELYAVVQAITFDMDPVVAIENGLRQTARCAAALGFELLPAVREKMAFNKTREHLHGKNC